MVSQGPIASSCRQWRCRSTWADAQADLSLRWAHILLVLSCAGSNVKKRDKIWFLFSVHGNMDVICYIQSDFESFSIALFMTRSSHTSIFTFTNNFLGWTYFGPPRFIHQWTTLVHMKLSTSDVTDKWNSWLADVTFDCGHAMKMAVEYNNQTHQL